VPHAGLSGAPGIGTLTASSRWHYGEKTTGSGVESRLSGVKILQRQRSPVVSGQWLGAPDSEQCTVRCVVESTTIGCLRLPKFLKNMI
jgi:hypothetical protein